VILIYSNRQPVLRVRSATSRRWRIITSRGFSLQAITTRAPDLAAAQALFKRAGAADDAAALIGDD